MTPALRFAVYLLVMAGVTYLVRLLPLLFIRREITNRFVRSFLYYVPYAVLTAMTFPSLITEATGSLVYGAVAAAVCIILAYFRRSLITVALGGALSVLLCELVAEYIIPLF